MRRIITAVVMSTVGLGGLVPFSTSPAVAAATTTTGTTKTNVSAYAGANTAADPKVSANHHGNSSLTSSDSDSGPDGSASGTVAISSTASPTRVTSGGTASSSQSIDASVGFTPSSVVLETVIGTNATWSYSGAVDTNASSAAGCISVDLSVRIYPPGSSQPIYNGVVDPDCNDDTASETTFSSGGVALEAGSRIKISADFTGPSSFASGTSDASFSVEVEKVLGPVTNTAQPTLTGTGRVGATLTTGNGTWTGEPDTFSYQWRSGGADVPGATAKTFKVRASDVGKVISCYVTASNGTTSASQYSRSVLGSHAPLRNTKKPTLSGQAKVGKKLTAMPGTWSPSPTRTTFQWLRNGVAIKGATTKTYQPVAKDKGKKVSVRVTATRSGYPNGVATSTAKKVTAS